MMKIKYGLILILGGLLFSYSEESSKFKRPNIVFAIADDMGMTSTYGVSWVRTPNMDSLAKNGILFTKAYSPDPKCSPSRACILTGRNPWQLEEAANHWPSYPAKFKSWMEALQDGGYRIGYTGKGWGPGQLPPERNLTGQVYRRFLVDPPAKGIIRSDYSKNFEYFLENTPQNAPFCFWYGGHEPHRKYEAGSGERVGGYKITDIDRVFSFLPDTPEVRKDMLDYAFEIANFDKHLGKIVEILKEKKLLEDTLIVVTSDNGPPYPRLKGHIFEEAANLPLVVSWPNGIQNPGRRCEELVSYIDFAPTFLELGEVKWESSRMQPITGKSFTDLLFGAKSSVDRSTLLLGRERQDSHVREGGVGYPVRGIRSGQFLYTHNFEPNRWPSGDPEMKFGDSDGGPVKKIVIDGGEKSPYWQACFGKRPEDELYDVEKDPDCMNNLAANPEYQSQMLKLRENLFAQLKNQQDPRMEGKGKMFDSYVSPRKKFNEEEQ